MPKPPEYARHFSMAKICSLCYCLIPDDDAATDQHTEWHARLDRLLNPQRRGW